MKIIIAGDFCPQERVHTIIADHNYSQIFGETKEIIQSADISIVNLECPVVKNNSEKAIVKTGPNLKGSPLMVDALKFAGFNMATLANNHFLDYGSQGAYNTFEELRRAEIEYLGAGDNLDEAAQPLVKEKDGLKVGCLNVCEYEFSIATHNSPGANPIDWILLSEQIRKIRNTVNYIILIVHGGHEHYQLPSPRMKRLYHFFINEGVDIIVNHHQHCYSGYEVYNGKYIFYGLGNYCFDNNKKRDSIWNEGFLLELNLDENEIQFELHPFEQCNKTVGIKLMHESNKKSFLSNIYSLNSIIKDDLLLNQSFENWINLNYNRYKSYISPYTNRYLRYLCRIGILPSFLNKNRRDVLYDMIKCESHNDIITKILER